GAVGVGGALAIGASRNSGNRASSLARTTADRAAHAVARIEVPTMAVGLIDWFAARMAMAVTGMSCTELVLIARNMHMAFVGVPGRGLSESRSRIARRPSGVAALPRPSMLAAMFSTMEPIAGCST